jgi:hypothetical protein
MTSRAARIVLLLLGLLVTMAARADTYDTHTLVSITVSDEGQTKLLYDCRVDIVGRRGDVYKALLTEDQLKELWGRGLRMEILYDEMAQDRRLWREADLATSSPEALAYYTASKFNLVTPPVGSLMEHLLQLYNAHPDICRLYNLGATQDGAYDIIAMKVTRNPDSVEAEPKIRIYANIHGDEKGGLMVACDVLDTILSGYTAVPQNAQAKKLVDESEMWFIPMGNPYGNAHNDRYNSRNVDLNRNFWGPAGSDYPPAWSEKETQILRDLTETATTDHRKMRFNNSISFHGGEVCFNSIWNYTHDEPSDEPIFWTSRTGGSGCGGQTYCPTLAPNGLAKAYQDGCTTSGFWFTEGYDWYGTRGDTNDWAYGAWTDLDTTIEVTSNKTPPVAQIPTYCAEHRQAVINFMLKTFQGIHGVMTDVSSGSPLDGTVAVTATASASIPVPHDYQAVYTDPVAGDFHRVLQPGTYTVTCKAAGYPDTVVTGVGVTADTKTACNCPMTAAPSLHYLASALTESCSGGGPYGGDGILDAGEDATLQVTLSNTGNAAATGVQATISTSTSGISLTGNLASFANIPGGGSSTSASPHFRFSVGTGVVCGTVITFNIHMTAVQGAWDDTLILTVGSVTPNGGTLLSETFDTGVTPPVLPTGWGSVDVSGSAGTWATNAGTRYPSGGGTNTSPNVAYFNSYTSASGSSTRLFRTSGVSIPASATGCTLSFFMYHDPGYSADNDAIQPQVSTDGGSAWINVGTAISRYAPKADWTQHTLSLAPYIGQPYVRAAFLGTSAYGNDCHIDTVLISYTANGACSMHACTPSAAPPETAPGETAATAQSWTNKTTQTWPTSATATSYNLYRGIKSDLPQLMNSSTDSCTKYTGAANSTATITEDPTGVAGGFYWYLVTGSNTGGEGPAGNATAGARIVNSSGACP